MTIDLFDSFFLSLFDGGFFLVIDLFKFSLIVEASGTQETKQQAINNRYKYYYPYGWFTILWNRKVLFSKDEKLSVSV